MPIVATWNGGDTMVRRRHCRRCGWDDRHPQRRIRGMDTIALVGVILYR